MLQHSVMGIHVLQFSKSTLTNLIMQHDNIKLLCSQKREAYQSSSWQSKATPLWIQCSSGLSVGIFIATTKLVECPVVERTPRRSLVL